MVWWRMAKHVEVIRVEGMAPRRLRRKAYKNTRKKNSSLKGPKQDISRAKRVRISLFFISRSRMRTGWGDGGKCILLAM